MHVVRLSSVAALSGGLGVSHIVPVKSSPAAVHLPGSADQLNSLRKLQNRRTLFGL